MKYALGAEDSVDILVDDLISGMAKDDLPSLKLYVKTAQIMNLINQGLIIFSGQSSKGIIESIFKKLAKGMSNAYDARAQRRNMLSAAFDLTSGTFVSQLYKDAATDAGLAVTDAKALDILDTVSNALADLNNVK